MGVPDEGSTPQGHPRGAILVPLRCCSLAGLKHHTKHVGTRGSNPRSSFKELRFAFVLMVFLIPARVKINSPCEGELLRKGFRFSLTWRSKDRTTGVLRNPYPKQSLKSGFNVLFWWLDERVTPDPIPNSEVKPLSSDDTLMEGKVASRRNKVLNLRKSPLKRGFFAEK